MTWRLRLAQSILVTLFAALAIPGVAIANPQDHREISSYVLTEAGLAKFTKATQNLSAIPGACDDDDDDDDASTRSIDAMVAEIDETAGAKEAIQSAGLTPREYVLFMFSMLQNGMAAWALSQPGGKLPPDVSRANVDFYKKHEAELAALGKNDPCDAESGKEEREE
ncbi:MAG TPA: hypothetical protein VFR77_01600 [Steroidobacteraceae bacterium]|nr:hypothetical protein [Steroidobacteraceae bacterium]